MVLYQSCEKTLVLKLQQFEVRYFICVFVHLLLSGQHVCVRLEKNTRDLGFSLEGGVDSNRGNRPLTVQKIFQGENLNGRVCKHPIVVGYSATIALVSSGTDFG